MWCHLEGNFGGGVFWEIHIHFGGDSGKFTYIFGGVFWEIHIHFVGGILGNSHTFCGGVFWEIPIHFWGGIMET